MNKKKIILLTIFTLSLIAILQYPVNKIIKFETSSDYTTVKFKVKVVDPYDPMRGRYVQLNPVPNTWNSKQKEVFSYNQSGYAVIKKNSDGFAEIVRLEQNRTELKPGEMAVKVTGIVSTQEDNTFSVYRFNWPFKRFYLNELKAPELEKELQKQDNSLDLKVKIFGDGSFAVIGLEKQ